MRSVFKGHNMNPFYIHLLQVTSDILQELLVYNVCLPAISGGSRIDLWGGGGLPGGLGGMEPPGR